MKKPLLLNFEKALNSLSEAMKKAPSNTLERDGVIQRFEYCLEISWNSAKKVLEYHELPTDSPRNVFRELAKNKWIENPEDWILYLEARNKTSHLYHEEVAEEIFKLIPNFLKSSLKLLSILQEKLR